MKSILPSKIKSARELRGLNQSELAKMIDVTRQVISLYESGERKPSGEVLLALTNTLNLPLSYFIEEYENLYSRTSPINFRKYKTTNKKLQIKADRLEELVYHHYSILENFLELSPVNLPDYAFNYTNENFQNEVEEIAISVRKFWGLKSGPISNVVTLLENNGVYISRVDITQKIDSFSCFRESRPLIILTQNKSAVRQRFDAAHELAHLLLHKNISEKESKEHNNLIEKQADFFASSFLMPKESFYPEVFSPTIEGFLLLKERWKVSIQAMIMRFYQLGGINYNQKSYLFKKLSYRKQRKNEPLDDVIEPELPLLFSKAIELLIENKIDKNLLLQKFLVNLDELCSIHSLDPKIFLSEEVDYKKILTFKK